jgi:TolB-like protein/Tfp pilus assembly protein PilF
MARPSFFEQLKRRQIVKSSLTYIAISWVVLQAASIVFPAWELPDPYMKYLIVLIITSFPLWVLMSWFYNFTSHGMVRASSLGEDMLMTEQGGRNLNSVIIGGMALAIILLLADRFFGFSEEWNLEDKSKSIAVLPFANASLDPSLAYLSNGIPENLINRLSGHSELKVLSRRSSFLFDEEVVDFENIKKKLDVDFVLSGNLEAVEDILVVNCQLVDLTSDGQIWGEKFYFNNENLLQLEDSIVASVLHPLQLTLKIGDGKDPVSTPAYDPTAYNLYLKGRHLSYGSTAEEAEMALEYFRRSIEIDPSFALGYVAIANEKINQAIFATATRDEVFNEAKLAVQSALALDPNLSEAYLVSGSIQFYGEFDWDGAEKSYRKALELDPANSNAYIRYSAHLTATKQYEKAKEMALKALTLDPISISSLHNAGWTFLVAKDFKASEKYFSEALSLHPNWIWGYVKRAYAKMFQDNYAGAMEDVHRAMELVGDWGSELLQAAMTYIHRYCGEFEGQARLTKEFFDRVNENNFRDPFSVGLMHYANNDLDQAIVWFQRSVDEGAPGSYQLNIDIFYDDQLRTDPRFIQLRKTMNFPD